mmetsp:Transcript_30240/g.34626  ORF Transcript_30240/g.34626 Transcript_30240/m.34626 type:complete len:213 (-) Transcript_30240:48-686(-)
MKVFVTLLFCTLLCGQSLATISAASTNGFVKAQIGEVEPVKSNELSNDINIFTGIRQLFFWFDRQAVKGFVQAFEATEDFPEKCMDDDFQEDFVANLWNVLNDLVTFRIFSMVVFLQHVLIFVSHIGNELINSCGCQRVVPEFINYFRLAFARGTIAGVIQTVKNYAVTAYNNFSVFVEWNLIGLGSLITFQSYYVGFAGGILSRIFIYGHN